MIQRTAPQSDPTGATQILEFSRDELTLLATAILESLGYAEIFPFPTYAKNHLPQAETLRNQIVCLLSHDANTDHTEASPSIALPLSSANLVSLTSSEPSSILMQVHIADINLFRSCLIDALQGIDDWEFQTRTGSTPAQAKNLALQLEGLLRTNESQ